MENKTRTLTIRLTESERSDLDCLAAIDRKTVSSYVRGLVVKESYARNIVIEKFKNLVEGE